MPVAANRFGSGVILHFVVRATDSHSRSVQRGIDVLQLPKDTAGSPSPQVAPLAIATVGLPTGTVGTPYSATLTAIGGVQPYSWRMLSGSLPSGLVFSAAGTITGTPSAAGSFSFSVSVSDSQGRSNQRALTLSVAAPQIPTSTSPNWSGYILRGSTYTGVGGTFNVPGIFASPTDTFTSEWVGIDGADASNPTILQLGVAERYSTSTNTYGIFAWIELFPQPLLLLPLSVSPGNSMTVAIVQAGAGVWTVGIKNNSTGQVWAANVPYSGPARSAEWIVEAPALGTVGNVQTVGIFSPVTFTQLGISPQPVQGSLTRWVMVQGGQAVATPSATSANGFTVAYGSATPAAP